jgi:hypothetical protein
MSESEFKIIHIYGHHLCGRVVKFRILDQDEVDMCERNGAEEAGEGADHRALRKAQLMQCVRAMIVAYTDPIEPLRVETPADKKEQAAAKGAKPSQKWVDNGKPDPEALAKAVWHQADATRLLTSWRSIFSTKDTEVLKMQFSEHHELNHLEAMMLSGKAQPFPAGA